MAMDGGLDGRPTWSSSKAVGHWGLVGFALAVRLFIWIASTYAPAKVHGAEAGLLMASVVTLASHLFILREAIRGS